MKSLLSLGLAIAFVASSVSAQYSGPLAEFAINNFFRVVSTGKNSNTNRNYPYPPTTPSGYGASPGVAAGTRYWAYTPPVRAQGGHNGTSEWTVLGMTQAIFVGAAVNTFPAPNHYQFKCGIAQATATANAPQKEHSKTATSDVFSVASQSLAINAGGIYEHNFTLTTPVTLPVGTDIMLFVEYKGGEWQDDPNGGQTLASDWRGGVGPGRHAYAGFASPSVPRTNMFQATIYRPKIGMLVGEPVFAATGHHGNVYYTPLLSNEKYAGLSAVSGPFHTDSRADMFFDIRAGSTYGAGAAVALMNVSNQWFIGKIPTPWGMLFLNPGDPAFGVLSSNQLLMTGNGVHNGETTPITIPVLGASALGVYIKCQGIVFNSGFQNAKFTNSSSILIQ